MDYGDCLFFTVSPNERHSCLVLRLSRFRVNDPHIKYSSPIWRRLAQADFPSMEAKKRKVVEQCGKEAKQWTAGQSLSGKSEDMSIEVELPEYDMRSLATAQDPHALVEGYRLNIYLRLSTVFGVRMCPYCPQCKAHGFGCQDRFGSNMRPIPAFMEVSHDDCWVGFPRAYLGNLHTCISVGDRNVYLGKPVGPPSN